MNIHLHRVRTLAIAAVLTLTGLFGGVPLAGQYAGVAHAAYTTGNLTYHNGDLMNSPTNYLIFWHPGGRSFLPAGSTYSDTQFENQQSQYFNDVCGSNLAQVDTQYSANGHTITANCSNGGVWDDTTNVYPGTEVDNSTDPTKALHDGDIVDEVNRAKAHFGSGGGNNVMYFVYTGIDVGECDSTPTCTFKQTPGGKAFCAWHSSRGDTVFGFISDRTTGSSANCAVGGATPNNVYADSATDTTEHEQMEANTDPYPGDNNNSGWFNGDGAHENGDQCNFYFGSADVNSDGANFIMGGTHRYRIQWEWSNALNNPGPSGDLGSSGCAPSYTTSGDNIIAPIPKAQLSVSPSTIRGNPTEDVTYSLNVADTSGSDGLYNSSAAVTLPSGLSYTSTGTGPNPTVANNSPGPGQTTLTYSTGTIGVGGGTSIVIHATPAQYLPDGATYKTTASFGGNDQVTTAITPDSDAKTISIVNAAPSLTPITPKTVNYHDTLSFPVVADDPDLHGGGVYDTLTLSATGLPSGMSFTDNGGGSGTVSTTDPAGVTATPGVYDVVLSVDDHHHPSPVTEHVSITVDREETALHYTGDTVIAQGTNTAHMSGRLLEDNNTATPIAGRTVNFTLGTVPGPTNTCSGVTNASGIASCTMNPVTVGQGPQKVTADFAGDTYFLPSKDSANVMIFAFLNHGTFTLGDKTVDAGTSPVTWWGAKWSSLNTLSGGEAPASFKGFAETTSTQPPTCGGTFSTDPGNSSSPPDAGSIPAYMGVAVSTSATKSGSAISGNISRIVVVKTSPGYKGNPGHAGTGTIVATYCH